MHKNVIPIYNGLTHLKGLQMNNLQTIEIANNNVIQLYIRVLVVLIWSLCRKEREKLDINLDSMVIMLARV